MLTGTASLAAAAFEPNYDHSIAASTQFFITPLRFSAESFANGVMQMTFFGSIGSNYVLQASTNLHDWTPLLTNSAQTNVIYFVDPKSSNYPNRFYRVLQQ